LASIVLSLHDALPTCMLFMNCFDIDADAAQLEDISRPARGWIVDWCAASVTGIDKVFQRPTVTAFHANGERLCPAIVHAINTRTDRKSTRLHSSHVKT